MNAGLIGDIDTGSLANTSSPCVGVFVKAAEEMRDTPFFRREGRDRDALCCHERDSGDDVLVRFTGTEGARECSESSSLLLGESISCLGGETGVFEDNTVGTVSSNPVDSAFCETLASDRDACIWVAEAPKISAGLIVSVRRCGVRDSRDDICLNTGERLCVVVGINVGTGLARSIVEYDVGFDWLLLAKGLVTSGRFVGDMAISRP